MMLYRLRRGCYLLVLLLGSFKTVHAQEPLTLLEAVQGALESSPAVEMAEAHRSAAVAGVTEARAGYLPRVSISETFQRGDNPVYAFGALLNQRRFAEADFAVARLNDPAPLTNVRTQLVVEQTLFDSFRTRSALRLAHAERAMAEENGRGTDALVIRTVVQAYFSAVLAGETLRVANEAVGTAEADFARAQTMFDAGLTTEADTLSVRVHLAAVQEEQIRARFGVDLAQATLNDTLGTELDTVYQLTTPLTVPGAAVGALDDYERLALEHHPHLRQAVLGDRAAASRIALARSALLPQVVAQGVFEADRHELMRDGGGNWLAAVGVRWDLWNGAANRAALAGARHAEVAAKANRRQVVSALRLAVRRAFAETQASAERVAVATAAVAHAESSHEIVQNRYEAGLAVVTELIRSETALLETRLRHLAALYDQRVARVALDEAAGTLTPASESLRD